MLMGCGCGVKSLSGMRGVGAMPQGYSVSGYCETDASKYSVITPNGVICMSDADITKNWYNPADASRVLENPIVVSDLPLQQQQQIFQQAQQTQQLIQQQQTQQQQQTTSGEPNVSIKTINVLSDPPQQQPNPIPVITPMINLPFDPVQFAKDNWMYLAGGVVGLYLLTK